MYKFSRKVLTASIIATFVAISSGAVAKTGAGESTWGSTFTLGNLSDAWCSTFNPRPSEAAYQTVRHRTCLGASQKVRAQGDAAADPWPAFHVTALGTASVAHWKTAPRVRARAHEEKTSDGVFSSVPLRVGALPAVRRLEATYADIGRDDLFVCGTGPCSTARATMSQVIEAAKSDNFTRKLEIINGAVNRLIAYRSDNDNYGVRDYWAAPSEALARQIGDCEDFAIVKMAALASAGIPMKSMSIVVLQDDRRKLFHAVLSVRTSKGHFILDNLNEEVLKDDRISTYTPLYSVSAGRGYIHGRQTGASHTLARSFELQSIAPGEGPSTLVEPH